MGNDKPISVEQNKIHQESYINNLSEFNHFFQEAVDFSKNIDMNLLQKPETKKQLSKYVRSLGDKWFFDYRDESRRNIGEISPDIFKSIYSLFRHLYQNIEDYDTYKKYLSIFCNIIGIPSIHKIAFVRYLSKGNPKDLFVEIAKIGKTFPIDKSTKLYHTSKNPNLTELTPTFRSSVTDEENGRKYVVVEAAFTTKRCYLGYNKPVAREGGTNARESWFNGERTYCYEVIDPSPLKIAYEDMELRGGIAVYVNTDKPIKVRKITYEEYMNGVVQETVITSNQRDKLNDSDFGIPELRKYPLHDKSHVEAAVKMFPHAPLKYRKSLAKRILNKANEYGIDTSNWKSLNNYKE